MSKIFVGREKELKKLTHCYSLGDQELAIVYGRRRIGKTALLSKFTEDKNTLWITGIKGKRELVFEAMTREVNKFFAPEDKIERVFEMYWIYLSFCLKKASPNVLYAFLMNFHTWLKNLKSFRPFFSYYSTDMKGKESSF